MNITLLHRHRCALTIYLVFFYDVDVNRRHSDFFTNHFVAKTCPAGMQYTECGSLCPRTCSTLYVVPPEKCAHTCEPMCQCRPGHFLHNGQCINETKCPCSYHRHEYSHGSEVQMGCKKW